jgi:hypothetical protein
VGAVKGVGQLRDASEVFIHVAQFEPRISEILDTVSFQTDKDEDGFETTFFTYIALIPIGFADDETWIVMNEYEQLNHGETDAVINQMQQHLKQTSREKVKAFPYDQIQYLEKVKFDGWREILRVNGIEASNPVFLNFHLEDLSTIRMNMVWFFGGAYLVLSIFFFGAVAFGHYEEIVND